MKTGYHLLLSLVLASSCNTLKLQENPPFDIQEASYHYWTGGQPNVGGINVVLKYSLKDEVSFEAIYFQGKKGNVEKRLKGEIPYLIGRINTSTPNSVSVNGNKTAKEVTDMPFEVQDDEALLVYSLKEKTFYYKVKGLEQGSTKFFE